MPLQRIRAHYGQLSEFERGRFIEADWTNQRIARHTGQSDAVLEDAGKNGGMADFNILMVAVDLVPQQIGRTYRLPDQLSQRHTRRYQPSDVLHSPECPP
ncbi:hypothetical protein TNCV_4913241 [Trichonephila clavipes]|nr:hypothetical protein TNCV_4913241 [Trichonephila clavipes]